MTTYIDRLTERGCQTHKQDRVCRSRGGESCAFDGAMIVLQPIADAAHIVHGPIGCCGNSWEGRGTISSRGNLYKMGFTTDMGEMDIVYGSEDKLYTAILKTYEAVSPKAIFIYSTCVSGLIGEDIEAVCKKAETALGIRVIPVNAPGFVGPKNLGNRIAGEVLLHYVIGTGEPAVTTNHDINLIGEYNIAGDLWLVEPVLKRAGIRVLSRITGDCTFEEITYAHRAKLNVVVCSRALINIAKEMERRYGIPYVEVSFFGKTEMSKAMRAIKNGLDRLNKSYATHETYARIEAVITEEEKLLEERLKAYEHLKGKRAVLYTGGVKSWSFISALMDLGIGIVAVGTKKSTFEDEEKMKGILGQDAPLIEDVAPKNLLRLLKERDADMLIAGGRNQYLAIKEGYPFVDVNQERHRAYAGYEGLLNLAEDISKGLHFYERKRLYESKNTYVPVSPSLSILDKANLGGIKGPAGIGGSLKINPLRHPQSIGAAIAFQGIDRALPIIHGAQGCTFLGKVLLTKHFREPIALASTGLFTEDVVMGSEEKIINKARGFIEKNRPSLIGILTSGLSEVKGDDVTGALRDLVSEAEESGCKILYVSTPDYEEGLERGYSKAVEAILSLAGPYKKSMDRQVNVLVGSHLTPADFTELRETIESFSLKTVILPDLSALDGSRQGVSALAIGGTRVDEIIRMGSSVHTIAIGASMGSAAMMLKDRFGIEYTAFGGLSGLRDTDSLMETLSMLSRRPIPAKYERQRRVLVDAMRDAHFYYVKKKICLALENDLSLHMSSWLYEMGAEVKVVDVNEGDLFSLKGGFDLLISNSHAEETAKRLKVPLYQMGFPVYKVLGSNQRITIGYKGAFGLINDIANLLLEV